MGRWATAIANSTCDEPCMGDASDTCGSDSSEGFNFNVYKISKGEDLLTW